MRPLIALMLLLLLAPTANAQAVWKGREYSHRVCNNPNCRMCASIQQQIAAQQRAVPTMGNTYWQQVRQPVQLGGGVDDGYEQYRTETTLEPQSKLVKRCDGRNCWYETVTEMVPVTRQVPVERPLPQAPASPPAVPQATAAVDVLTNTELVPTPQPVVVAMLEELCPSNKSKLFDLGCGDGRIVITAAKLFGCTAVGIELNPNTIAIARTSAVNEYVNPLVVFFQGDVRNYDLHSAEYVTMYLYPELMAQIVPKIKKGTQIASYQHEIPGVSNTKHSIDVDGQTHIFYTGIKP